MSNRQRYRIRVQETYEDCVWVEADSWEQAELKIMQASDLWTGLEFIGGRDVEWTGDEEEIN